MHGGNLGKGACIARNAGGEGKHELLDYLDVSNCYAAAQSDATQGGCHVTIMPQALHVIEHLLLH